MAKKKKLTPLEKQLEDHLYELYLRFIKIQQYNPDYLRELKYADFHDFKCMIAMAERARDAGRMSEEDFEFLKRELGGFTIAKVFLREYLGSAVESIISRGDSILSIKEQLKLPLELLIDFFTHVFHLFPKEKLPVILAGKWLQIDLRFTNNKISEAMDWYLKYFVSPVGQGVLDHWGWRPQLADGQVLEVILDPGKGPHAEDLESSMLVVSIDFNAGKMKIRKELDKLLKKLSPRDTKSTPKFSVGTWETDYQIYVLHCEERYTFKEIAAKLNMPPSTVKSAFQRIYKHIHQTDEYGTKKSRDELTLDITKGLSVSLEGAEIEYARAQMLGGWGAKMAPSGAYEDEALFFATEKKPRDVSWDRNTRFDNWGRRFGNTNTCHEDTLNSSPVSPMKWYKSPARCKFYSATERCSTCRQTYPNATYIDGNMEGAPYVRRRFTESTEPTGEHREILASLLEEFARWTPENPEQVEYIASNGVTKCPRKVAKGFTG